jgi:hypothetical protein
MRGGRSTVRTSPSHVSPLLSESRGCRMLTGEQTSDGGGMRTDDLIDGRERRRGMWWD